MGVGRTRACATLLLRTWIWRRRRKAARSQGGVQFPTGGNGVTKRLARERLPARHFHMRWQGQQTWCDSRADGHSPDKERAGYRWRAQRA